MNKGYLCTGQPAGSRWCPLQRGPTVLSFGLKMGGGGRGGLVVKSNDYMQSKGNEGWPGITSKAVGKKRHSLTNNTA